MSRTRAGWPSRAQVYLVARSAHLERLRSDPQLHLFYRRENYDFEIPMDVADRIHRLTFKHLLGLLNSPRTTRIEINEPFLYSAWHITVPLSALGILANSPKKLTFYAIDNADVAAGIQARTGLPRPLGRLILRLVATLILRNCSSVIFGTEQARANYERVIGTVPNSLKVTCIPPIEPRCTMEDLTRDRKASVLFLGTLDERKGIERVLIAWKRVQESRPDSELTIIGDGPLRESVKRACERLTNAQYVGALSRRDIHETLAKAKVLVLLSQRDRVWKEQIGLPILEGLSHGLEIVATEETGIADWLGKHQHQVLSTTSTDSEVAVAIVESLDRHRVDEILRDLPTESGRGRAHDLMMGPQ